MLTTTYLHVYKNIECYGMYKGKLSCPSVYMTYVCLCLLAVFAFGCFSFAVKRHGAVLASEPAA